MSGLPVHSLSHSASPPVDWGDAEVREDYNRPETETPTTQHNNGSNSPINRIHRGDDPANVRCYSDANNRRRTSAYVIMPTTQPYSYRRDRTEDEQLNGSLIPLKRNYYQGWMEPTGGQ